MTMIEDQRAANFILNEAGILKETPSPKPTKQKLTPEEEKRFRESIKTLLEIICKPNGHEIMSNRLSIYICAAGSTLYEFSATQ